MNMFKLFLAPILVLVLVLTAVPTALSIDVPKAQVIDLPGDTEAGIQEIMILLVSWLFMQLITLVPWLGFLDQFKLPLAVALSAELIAFLEASIPGELGVVANAAIVLVLAILAVILTINKLVQANAPGFRARA